MAHLELLSSYFFTSVTTRGGNLVLCRLYGLSKTEAVLFTFVDCLLLALFMLFHKN